MSTLLTAQSLHVDTAFGTLFDDLSFTLKKGDRIGQGIFMKYLTVNDDTAGGLRTGGIGSTGV